MSTAVEKVVSLLEKAGEPLTKQEIAGAPEFKKVSEGHLSSILTRMAQKGKIQRVRWGVYAMPEAFREVAESPPVEEHPPQPVEMTPVTPTRPDTLSAIDEVYGLLNAKLIAAQLHVERDLAFEILRGALAARGPKSMRELLTTDANGERTAVCCFLAGYALGAMEATIDNR